MAKRIEVNPGEMFLVGDNVVLVKEYESVLGMLGKIGTDENDRVAYLWSFTGKVNNKDRTTTYTVALDPNDALAFVNDVLHGLEMLQQAIRDTVGKVAEERPAACPRTKFPDGTHCGDYGWHATNCPEREVVDGD